MALKRVVARTSSILAPLIGLALVGYIVYLVLVQYRTQMAVQEAELRQLASDSTQRAAGISFFFNEREEDLLNLAQSRELSAYFENQALGMSMEYGLKASLIMIDDLLHRTRDTNLLVGRPIYERIVIVDASGTLLADTRQSPSTPTEQWTGFLSPKARVPAVTAVRTQGGHKLRVSSPAFFKGRYAGQVVAWVSAAEIYRHFVAEGGAASPYPTALVLEGEYVTPSDRVRAVIGSETRIPLNIRPLAPYPLRKPAKADARTGFAILVPVEGTPLSFVTFIPPEELSDPTSHSRMLYTTGCIALFMLVGMLYFQRVNTSNAVLQAHLEETTLREAAVDERNRLLAAEIEERRQTEHALRASEARFRAIVSAVPVVIFEYRYDGQRAYFSFMSEKILEVAGVPAEAVVADPDALFGQIHPEDRDAALAAIQRSVVSHACFSHECRIVKPSGETRWLVAGSLPQRCGEGGEKVWYGCLEDITNRKQAEQLVRESEATLRSLMDSMPAGVWWFNEAGKVEYLNSRFVELFRYRPEEVQTVAQWLALICPDLKQREAISRTRLAAAAEVRRSREPVPPLELMVTCGDGTVRHVIVNTQFCQGHTLEIFTDITEQEFINNELLKVQKMESLGVLAGGIAHDFNNILTGVMGNISFANLLLDEENEARVPLHAAEIAAQRAAELSRQLLTFARGGEPIKKVVDLRRLVAESLSLALRGTSVQGKTELAENLHSVEADEGQMHQAFNNIALNAAHAMQGGGTFTVRGKNEAIRAGNRLTLKPGSYVKLTFQDEGCGIDEATLKNIFDPYFTTKAGGNGLGLASTLSIVRRHGGHIQVESKVGVGTTFTLYLPSTGQSVPQAQAQPPRTSDHHRGGSILVMDDEEMLRVLSTRILTHLGYQVTTCANGEEAIRLYREAREKGVPYFAVIMDLTVPGGMGGKEAAEQILRGDPGAKLIVSSGYSNDQALAEYKNYGFCGAVLKPYKVAELAETLATIRDAA